VHVVEFLVKNFAVHYIAVISYWIPVFDCSTQYVH